MNNPLDRGQMKCKKFPNVTRPFVPYLHVSEKTKKDEEILKKRSLEVLKFSIMSATSKRHIRLRSL